MLNNFSNMLELKQDAETQKRNHYSHIVELIRCVVSTTPSSIAIIENDIPYTYQDLWNLVESFAKTLTLRSVKCDDVIAIHAAPSIFSVTAILATWVIGAIAFPLDKQLPLERKRKLLEKANTLYLLCANADDEIQGLRRLQNIVVPLHLDTPNRSLEVRLSDKAYIFPTSGSTGEPKLILGSHNSLSHFLNWQKNQFNIMPMDRGLLLTGLSFDVMLRDIFLALISGATLFIVASHMQMETAHLLAYINNKKISYLHVVPSKLKVWLNGNVSGVALKSLRLVFSAGEPLTAEILQKWREQNHIGNIINLYGPTETTLAKFFYFVDHNSNGQEIPVGFPIPGVKVYIIKEGKMCSQGESGEVVIRTPYGTYGYLGNSDQKIPHRFLHGSSTDPEVLYYTGDIGFLNTFGELVLQGRNDHQIKINGVRIEPEEIEVAVAQLKNIKGLLQSNNFKFLIKKDPFFRK